MPLLKRTACHSRRAEGRNTFTEKEEVTTTVTLLGILPGLPPRILTGKRLGRGGKPGRLFQQMVPVPAADLFARLIAKIGTGDMLTVTVTTEWRVDGYETHLSAFALPVRQATAGPEEVRA